MPTTLDRYLASSKTATIGSPVNSGTTLDKYLSKSKTGLSIEDARKAIAERDAQLKQEQQAKTIQDNNLAAQENFQTVNNGWLNKINTFFGRGVSNPTLANETPQYTEARKASEAQQAPGNSPFTQLIAGNTTETYKDIVLQQEQDKQNLSLIQQNSDLIKTALERKKQNPGKADFYDNFIKGLTDKNSELASQTGGAIKDKTDAQLRGQALGTAAELSQFIPIESLFSTGAKFITTTGITLGVKDVAKILTENGVKYGGKEATKYLETLGIKATDNSILQGEKFLSKEGLKNVVTSRPVVENALYGGAFSAGPALQENATPTDIAKQTAVGAGAGGILGGLIPGAISLVSKAIMGLTRKITGGVTNLVTKKLDSSVVHDVVKTIESTGTKVSSEDTSAIIDAMSAGATKEDIVSAVEQSKPGVTIKTETPQSPLLQEAKKYKSAEEFVNNKEVYYRGTTAPQTGEIKPADTYGLAYGKGVYLASDARFAKDYGPNVSKYYVDWKNPFVMDKPIPDKIIDRINKDFTPKQLGKRLEYGTKGEDVLGELPLNADEANDYLQKLGFDGLKDASTGYNKQSVIFDTSILKTKSQLTDLYNKAQGGPVKGAIIGDVTKGKTVPEMEAFFSKQTDEGLKQRLGQKISAGEDNLIRSELEKRGLSKAQGRVEKVKVEPNLPKSEVLPKVEPKAPETKTSSFAERLNKDLPDEFKLDNQYEIAPIKQDAEKAAALIAKDKERAIRIATGIEKSSEQTQTATNIELGEIAKREKDWATVNELFNIRREANTRRGQEIAMEKMSVLLNPEEKFMKDVVNARLGKVKLVAGEISKVMKQITEKVKVIKDDIVKATNVKLKVEKAQKLLDSLIC